MTREQIEQMAIEYDRNLKSHPMSAGELRKNLVEFAMQVVKNCSMPNVVEQSEQLLAVAEYVYNHFDDSLSKTAKDYLQDFLSQ